MATIDPFVRDGTRVMPLENASAVTPNDAADNILRQSDNQAVYCRAIYVSGSGDVKLTLVSGDVVTLAALSAGIFHPIRAGRIWSTGTTATGIVAAW